jgi:hypothetical protein
MIGWQLFGDELPNEWGLSLLSLVPWSPWIPRKGDAKFIGWRSIPPVNTPNRKDGRALRRFMVLLTLALGLLAGGTAAQASESGACLLSCALLHAPAQSAGRTLVG